MSIIMLFGLLRARAARDVILTWPVGKHCNLSSRLAVDGAYPEWWLTVDGGSEYCAASSAKSGS
jgi:hypothetical protein